MDELFEPSTFVQSLTPALPNVGAADDGEETSTDSQTETETDDGKTGEDGQPVDKSSQNEDDKKPFHEHPRFKEVIDAKNKANERAEAAEKRIADLESKINQRQEVHAELTEADIPDWFNGDLDTYKKYHAHQTKLLEDKATAIAEGIVDKRFKENEAKTQAQIKAEQDATAYFNAEVAAIESDEKLNPTKAPIDKQALLKIAIDNDCVDSKQRWNWKAAYRIYAAQNPVQPNEEDEETKKERTQKKNIAAITTQKDSKAEPNSHKRVKTAADFKKDKPW